MDWFQTKKSWIATEVIDLGIPNDAVRREDLRRIRILSTTTIGLCLAAGIPAEIQFVQLGMPVMATLIFVTMVASALNLLSLRVRRNPTVSAHIGVGILASVLLTSNVMTGGFYNPNFAWLYVVPLAAAVVVDMRGAAIWTGLIACASIVFWLLPDFGVVLVNQVAEEAQPGNALFNRVSAILAIGVIGASFVTGQRRAEIQLETANDDLSAETRYVQLLMHAAVAANEALSFEDGLRDSMKRICETMDWVAGHIYTVNGDGTIVTSGIRHSDNPALDRIDEVASKITFHVGDGVVGLAVSERVPQILESIAPDADPESATTIAQKSGIQGAISVPIFVGGDVSSVMLFATTGQVHDDRRLREVFTLIGTQLGKVAERTALQERVQHSQKMEAVGQLAAGVAHEINNPMAYVRTNLHTLREEWARIRSKFDSTSGWGDATRIDDCEELIEESLEGVERTIAIVRDIKEYSHDGAVDRDNWQETELSDLIDSALRVVSAKAPHGVHIYVYHGDASSVRCSANQIRQVFVNLIVNAIDAVGESGSIQLETGSDINGVFARVQDDGPGMSEATRERLFDPFYTTKPVGEGTGLGLSVSYDIVRKHGGEILVASEIDGGAQFEVRLPSEA